MLAILLYLEENLERTYFLRYTTRLKSCPRVRMNLFSKSCFPISWTNTSLLVIPLVGMWYNSVQMTKIRLWVVTLLEVNQKILLLCKLWIVISKDFWSCYSSTYLVIDLVSKGYLSLNATFSRTLFLVVIIVTPCLQNICLSLVCRPLPNEFLYPWTLHELLPYWVIINPRWSNLSQM
jgi:hypothetical protein